VHCVLYAFEAFDRNRRKRVKAVKFVVFLCKNEIIAVYSDESILSYEQPTSKSPFSRSLALHELIGIAQHPVARPMPATHIDVANPLVNLPVLSYSRCPILGVAPVRGCGSGIEGMIRII
jgi:hypothetical protein